MSDEHIDTLLGSEDDAELTKEVKAYETEQEAVQKAAEEEPEPETEEPELEASDEAETEEQAEPEAEPEKQAEPPKQVDLKALQAVRAENQQLKQQMNQLSLYMQQLQQNMTPQQQPEEAIPDPDENPIEALSWLMKQQSQQAEAQKQQTEQQQQEVRRQQVQQNYAMQAQQFEQQTPDFKDAYNHLIQNRAQELAIAGMSQDQIAEQINREELNMAAHALQMGMNPAQQIYEMAKLRGYAGRKPVAQQQPAPQQRQEMEEARKAASINTNRSAPPAKAMTLEQIADLEGAAFDKAMAKWERENGLAHKTLI